MEVGQPEGQLAARLLVHRPEQEDLLAVAHWCCTHPRSLFARVSPVDTCALLGIESYQGPSAVALKLLQHSRAAVNP